MTTLSQNDVQKLEKKIAALEEMSSAELKIIFCKHAWFGIDRKAARLFKKYGMDKTRDKNAVLLLIVENDRELLIYGDSGIYQKASNDHWPAVRDAIVGEFKKSNYYVGLAKGIEMIGSNLVEQFPAGKNNNNELSNEIIFI